MLNNSFLNKFYQEPEDNILLTFGELASRSKDLINLSIGDPDIKTPQAIIDSAFLDVSNGHTHYTASDGDKELIDSIIRFYNRHYQLDFKSEDIRATVGALQGMYLTLQVLLDPGDEVIIHEPFFSPYKTQVIEAKGVPVVIPTFEKDDFQIDPILLKKAITPKTKAIIINSPNNPTGAIFSKETLEQIADIAIKHHLFILSDEVYEAFSFYDDFTPMASLAPENTITFSSFSKAFAMTGWRLGYMIAPSYINDACRLLNEDITYSAPTPSQRAGIFALEHYEELVPSTTLIFQERLEYIEKRVAEIDFLSLRPVKGSMYAFINIQKTGLKSVEFAMKLLEEQQVLVIPGKAFGSNSDDYVRVAATRPIEELEMAFDRIEKLIS